MFCPKFVHLFVSRISYGCFCRRLIHCNDALIVESVSFTKLLQSLPANQLVIAVSHDDMQTQ